MTTDIITLTKKQPIFQLTEPTIRMLYTRPKATKLTFELLEIKNVDTPSTITIIIQNGGKKTFIELFKYRTQFMYQNNIFILDTKAITEFDVPLPDLEPAELVKPTQFSIKAYTFTEEDFVVNLYGATDQPEQKNKWIELELQQEYKKQILTKA